MRGEEERRGEEGRGEMKAGRGEGMRRNERRGEERRGGVVKGQERISQEIREEGAGETAIDVEGDLHGATWRERQT